LVALLWLPAKILECQIARKKSSKARSKLASPETNTPISKANLYGTAQIKNVGEASVFVFPRTSFEDDGDGVFIVRVTETPKCKFVFTNHAGTPAPPTKDLRFADYVQSSWKLLKPGKSLQAQNVFRKIDSPLCPGKYALTVTYLTELFWWTGERIHASESELPFPAVFGVYRGNAITFQVQGTNWKTSDH